MSGGSLDYIHRDVRDALREGTVDPDSQAGQVVGEIADLLHDIEWSESGDYAPDQWRATLAEFCAEWHAPAREHAPEERETVADTGDAVPVTVKRGVAVVYRSDGADEVATVKRIRGEWIDVGGTTAPHWLAPEDVVAVGVYGDEDGVRIDWPAEETDA